MIPSAIIFDLDGTLHNRALGIEAFAAAQFDRLGTPPADAQTYIDRFIELDANGLVWKDRVYEVLREEFDLIGAPSVSTLVQDYVDTYPGFAIEIDNSTDTLRTMRAEGLKVGILTNGPSGLQRSVISALGFDEHVDAVVISEDVGLRKPQPEIFSLMTDRLCVDPSETFMVGDSLSADIEGAIAAGIQPIAFQIPSPPADVTRCDTMNDLANIVLRSTD